MLYSNQQKILTQIGDSRRLEKTCAQTDRFLCSISRNKMAYSTAYLIFDERLQTDLLGWHSSLGLEEVYRLPPLACKFINQLTERA